MTLIILVTMLAMAPEVAAAVMPGIPALIATAVIVTQIVKRGINTINIGFLNRVIVQEAGAVVLAVLTAAGVVVFWALKTQTPLDLDLAIIAGSVMAGSPLLKKIFKGKE